MRCCPSSLPHALFVAGPSRGKGVDVVAPSLLAVAGPPVVLDVKGELLRDTAHPPQQVDDAALAAKREPPEVME